MTEWNTYVDKSTIFLPNIKSSLSGTEPGFKLKGVKVIFQKFWKIEISILKVDNNALLALIFLIICIFLFWKKKSQMTIYNQDFVSQLARPNTFKVWPRLVWFFILSTL